MKIDKADYLAAISTDESALQTAEKILQDALSDYAKVPFAMEQACDYLQNVSADLYAQLKLALEEPDEWSRMLLERMMEEEYPNIRAAALAQLACQAYGHSDAAMDRAIGRLAQQQPAAPQNIHAIIHCFQNTPMECAFCGSSQGKFPCLDAAQVRRLGVMLSAVFYREWIRRCAQDAEGSFSVECADLYTMAVWGFGYSEMMCAKSDEDNGSVYAHAVSMVAFSNLTVDFDDWRVLKSSLDSMMTQRDVFRATLEDLCSQMELEATETGHVFVQAPTAVTFNAAAWSAALERGVHTENSVSEEHSEKNQEEKKNTDDVTE